MIRADAKRTSENISLITIISKFESTVTAVISGKEYNAKSIMSTAIINASDVLDVYIDGKDQKQVFEAIEKYFVLEKF